jgi:hypothetical protein
MSHLSVLHAGLVRIIGISASQTPTKCPEEDERHFSCHTQHQHVSIQGDFVKFCLPCLSKCYSPGHFIPTEVQWQRISNETFCHSAERLQHECDEKSRSERCFSTGSRVCLSQRKHRACAYQHGAAAARANVSRRSFDRPGATCRSYAICSNPAPASRRFYPMVPETAIVCSIASTATR